jgi:predicted PurR-regulated permease PerM
MEDSRSNNARWIAIALSLAAVTMVFPFWPALLLALWTGIGGLKLMPRLTRFCRGRKSVAAVILLVGIAAIALPVLALLYTVALDAWAFVTRAMESDEWREVLERLVSSGESATAPALAPAATASEGSTTMLVEGSGAVAAEGSGAEAPWTADAYSMLVQYSERAWSAITLIAGAAVRATLDTIVFFVVLYAVLIDGPAAWAWLTSHSLLPDGYLEKYGRAFVETGHGLVVGFGGAALVQASIGTILFAAVGVSRALALGLLMFLGAAVPGVGTTFVWGPVAVGLYMSGRPKAAIVVVVVGLLIIGTIDNLLRPILTKHAALELPASVLFVTMIGGLIVLGPIGLVAGPLLVRLAYESLAIAREENASRRAVAEEEAMAASRTTVSLKPAGADYPPLGDG